MLKASRSGTAPYENGMPENGMPQAALVSRQSPCRAGIRHLCLPDTCDILPAYIQNGKGSSPNIARGHHPLAPTYVPRVGRDLINYAGKHAFISPQVRRAYTNLDPTEATCGGIKQKRWTVDANHFREMAGQSGHGLLRLTMCGTTCHNARPGRVSRWRCPSVYIPGFRMPNIHNRLVAEMIRTISFLQGASFPRCASGTGGQKGPANRVRQSSCTAMVAWGKPCQRKGPMSMWDIPLGGGRGVCERRDHVG